MIPYYRPPRPDSARLANMVKKVADSKMVTNGDLCRELESQIRDYHGAKYALACSSGTMGLLLALRVLRKLVDAKDCYLPSFTWSSTDFAAEAAGMNRVFSDVNPLSWTMLPSGKKGEITVPVSIFGCFIEPQRYGGHVLVDGAHMLGVPFDFSKVEGVVYSFAPSKLLTCGEGGILLTDSAEVAAGFDTLRNRYARMSEANAAMGLCQWEGLQAYVRDRANRWKRYARRFKTPQKVALSNYTTFAARVKDREALMKFLYEKGIETRAYYEPLVAGLKNADALGKEVLCLPNWYGCPDTKVIEALEEYSKDPI